MGWPEILALACGVSGCSGSAPVAGRGTATGPLLAVAAPSTASAPAPSATPSAVAAGQDPRATGERMAHALEERVTARATEQQARLSSLASGLGVLGGSSATPAPAPPDAEPPDVVVDINVHSARGHYDRGAFEFALKFHDSQLASCMAKAGDSDRKGRLTAELRFDKDGMALLPVVSKTTFRDKDLVRCLLEVLETVDPAAHTTNGPGTQANQRATVDVAIERAAGF